jgi:hypothetical protein
VSVLYKMVIHFIFTLALVPFITAFEVKISYNFTLLLLLFLLLFWLQIKVFWNGESQNATRVEVPESACQTYDDNSENKVSLADTVMKLLEYDYKNNDVSLLVLLWLIIIMMFFKNRKLYTEFGTIVTTCQELKSFPHFFIVLETERFMFPTFHIGYEIELKDMNLFGNPVVLKTLSLHPKIFEVP